MSDLIANLQRLGDEEHDDLSVAFEALAEIIKLRLERSALLDRLDAAECEIERLRAVVSALAFQANRDPFTTIGHWCEHGPCAAIIRDVSNPYADHHGPDWTQRDSEYLK
jgi:hypothetical protein